LDTSLQVLLVSIWDVRVAMPLAILLGLKPWQAIVWGISGVLVILPFLLLFQELLELAHAKLPQVTGWLVRLNARHRVTIEKFGYWGILLFVAIPLPGSGTWTGAFVAGLLQMNAWKSFLVVLAGAAVSGLLTMLLAGVMV